MLINQQKEKASIQLEELKIIGSSVLKIIIVVCFTLIAGLTIHSCSVSKEMIQSCQAACEKDGKMRSVSSFKCSCDNTPDKPDIFAK